MNLDKLNAIIKDRVANATPKTSYVAKLYKRGKKKICEKIGEEATEVIIDAVASNRKEVVNESADLLFHLSMLWVKMGIEPKEVMDELEAREGISGLDEKANRSKKG